MKKNWTFQPFVQLSLLALLATSTSFPLYAGSLSLKPDARIAQAVQRNDPAAVQSLLQQHVPVDSAEGDGTTGLHWAAYDDNLPVAKLLLDAHANVHATTRLEELTPLLMACGNGSAPMIDLLLAHGAGANDVNALGTTPLMLAAASGSTAAVQTLLDHGADPNAREHTHGQTALVFAANYDRADVITVLLAHHADPNAATRVLPIVRAQLREVPITGLTKPVTEEADASDGEDKAQPRQAHRGEKEVPATSDQAAAKPATQQIGAGVPEELQPAAAKTPPDEAKEPLPPTPVDAASAGVGAKAGSSGRRRRNEPAAGTASGSPAGTATAAATAAKRPGQRDRGATSIGGMTPLLFAARQGTTSAVKALLAGGAAVDQASGSEQTTPLVMAIANGHFDTARALLEGGANPNLVNVMGLAPLYATIDVEWAPHEWSAEPVVAQEHTTHIELMNLLLAHGANPNARLGKRVWSRSLSQDGTWTDPAGATAFWRAAQADDVAAMKLLVAGGADPKIPSKVGATPLMLAAGLGWGLNYSVGSPGERMTAVEYCLSQGNDVNAVDETGYTALHGAAFIGDNAIIKYLASKGANADRKTKAGDSPADMANGPFAHSIPYPDTVALLEKLGAPNAHDCRSDQCIVASKEEKVAGIKAPENKPVDNKAAEPLPLTAHPSAQAPAQP
jgi:ankyrin repeat protein